MLTGVGGRNFQTLQHDSLAPKNMLFMFQKSKIARFLKFIEHHQLGTAATRALRERLSRGWLGRRSGQMAVRGCAVVLVVHSHAVFLGPRMKLLLNWL